VSSIDEQFVEFVIKSLVTKPEEVKIERRIDEKGVLLELTVDPEDLGRVIGKRGATAQSVRTLLRALGTKNDARYNLKIVDNGVGGGSNAGSTSDSSRPSDDSVKQDDSSSSGGDDAWATSSSSDSDEADSTTDSEEESDVVAKTRRELQDLDDLDV
jgi:predicted RNA-binding protein YlqC (UPF0109 family)